MKVRVEYLVAQRLTWDAAFRRAFYAAPQDTLRAHFPDLGELQRFGPQQFAGIEDEAFRREAEACRAAKDVFPRGYPLLLAHGGEAFVEQLLSSYLRPDEHATEPFSVSNIAPRVIEAAASPRFDASLWFTRPVLRYEWARYVARTSIEEGRDPAGSQGGLVAGASLVFAPFDLPSLLLEVERVASSGAPHWVLTRRCRPGPGQFRRVIYPHDRRIVEADVDEALYGLLEQSLEGRAVRWGESEGQLLRAGLLKQAPS